MMMMFAHAEEEAVQLELEILPCCENVEPVNEDKHATILLFSSVVTV